MFGIFPRKIYEAVQFDRIKRNVSIVFGNEDISFLDNQAIVLCLVRNGEPWIKDFIEHYKKLGFTHIVFLDTGSTDKTLEIAKEYENVTVLTTDIPFKGNNALLRRYLVEKFAKNRWSLTVDIDEFWDYPYSEQVPLSKFLAYLNEQGASAVVAQMLDMFMETIPQEPHPLSAYTLYDIADVKSDALDMKGGFRACGFRYNTMLNSKIAFLRGGVRSRLFGLDRVWLTKMPLLYNDASLQPLVHQHFSNNAVIADVSTVLLHYKFTHTFPERVRDALHRRQYFNNSVEYTHYYNALAQQTMFQMSDKNTKRLQSFAQLLSDDFLQISRLYEAYAERHSCRQNNVS